jgi:hypothetical protein
MASEKQQQKRTPFSSRTSDREKQQDYELGADSGLAAFVNSIPPGRIVGFRVTGLPKRKGA